MKKFERRPIDQRKQEIKDAALKIFIDKGFMNTTMENIIANVSLSKGGVYRIYPSMNAILYDLIIDGMHFRNEFYKQRIKTLDQITIDDLARMICDSLLIKPELSAIYVEFLIAKKYDQKLEDLYQMIAHTTREETMRSIEELYIDILSINDLMVLEDLMNAAILSITTLNLQDPFLQNKDMIVSILTTFLTQRKDEPYESNKISRR